VDVIKIPYRAPSAPDDPAARWWFEPEDRIHRSAFAVAATIEQKLATRRTLDLVYACLYENVTRTGFSSGSPLAAIRSATGASVKLESLGSGQKSTHNTVKSAIDTACARIAKNKPRVKYVTQNGNWSQQQRARKLTQFTDAMFRVSEAYEEGEKAFRDACVFGTGFLHPYIWGDQIRVERVLPWEILVDEVDGQHGHPRQLHRKKNVPRDELIAMFPAHRKAIEEAPCANASGTSSTVDEVTALESWHLRSGPKAEDGRHTLCLENVTLLSEEWKRDYFPFPAIRWCPRLVGFWGAGLAEEMAGIQLKVNTLDRMIVEGVKVNCVPRVFIPHGSVANTHSVWDYGAIAYKGTTPPTFNTAPGMPPEVYAERDKEISYSYEMPGVSQLSASSQKPAGLNSGAALREYQDQTSERFSLQGQRWEALFVELARQMLDLARDLHARGVQIELLAKGQRITRRIKLADVLLEESDFIRQAFPVSQLPNTPEGRLQFVQELAQAGYIDRDMAMELLQLGDVDDAMGLLTAAFDDAMLCIDTILEDGRYIEPVPEMNLALTLKLAQSSLLRAHVNGAPEDRQEDMRTFMSQLLALQQIATANATQNQAPGMGGGTPIATPQPAPTSDLLPAAA
jgi:hypothetical protein